MQGNARKARTGPENRNRHPGFYSGRREKSAWQRRFSSAPARLTGIWKNTAQIPPQSLPRQILPNKDEGLPGASPLSIPRKGPGHQARRQPLPMKFPIPQPDPPPPPAVAYPSIAAGRIPLPRGRTGFPPSGIEDAPCSTYTPSPAPVRSRNASGQTVSGPPPHPANHKRRKPHTGKQCAPPCGTTGIPALLCRAGPAPPHAAG